MLRNYLQPSGHKCECSEWFTKLNATVAIVAILARRTAGRGAIGIQDDMRFLLRGSVALAIIVLLNLAIHAGTPGSFRGTIVDNPQNGAGKNWIYVQGRNGMARRVDVSHARVMYDDEVPASARLPKPEDALTAGVEVRVTAEQDDNGEWRASRVEILKQQLAASK